MTKIATQHRAAQTGRSWLERWRARVNVELTARLQPLAQTENGGLGAAIAYATLSGGKRLRALLTLAACQSARTPAQRALPVACAVELIHAYSLAHDDMPCMDNDLLRHGVAALHVRYGQALALLAGDVMQSMAFEWLCAPANGYSSSVQARLCAELAHACGMDGMGGGQALDLANTGEQSAQLDESALQTIHLKKTARLIQAAVHLGALCAQPRLAPRCMRQICAAANLVGLAYQIQDDALDLSDALGKTRGRDRESGKTTYVDILGVAGAFARARELYRRALEQLRDAALPDARPLRQVFALMAARQN